MQLVINTYGSSLKVKDGLIYIKAQENEFEVSPKKVQSIVITTGVFFTSDVLKLALEHNIDVVLLDEFGEPYGRFWHSRFGSTAAIRRQQLESAYTEQGLDFARKWVGSKVSNQIEFLKKLLHNRPGKDTYFADTLKNQQEFLNKIQSLDTHLSLEQVRGTLMGLEGTASRIYFEALGRLIPERWKFNGRSRQPAVDPFNCMLNYAYGVFYSVVERACILAGLDPYVGFLHTDNYGKVSLVYDLIEPFRIYADTTVFYLFSGRQAKQEHFDAIPGGLSLNKEGKKVLMAALNEFLDEKVRHKGRNIKRRDTIQSEAHWLANQFLGEKDRDIDLEIKEV